MSDAAREYEYWLRAAHLDTKRWEAERSPAAQSLYLNLVVSSLMAFNVGQKVVCVGGSEARLPYQTRKFWAHWRRAWGVAAPAKGSIYTIRETRNRKDGTQGVRLVEIVNPICEWSDAPPQEPWYHAEDFRPLLDRPTDIEVFKCLLVPADQLEDA